MPTVVVPDLGDVTDPQTIQEIHDDLTALESDVSDLQDLAERFVRKTADESVTSSAALQNDDHLLLAAASNITYRGAVHLWATSAANAAGDITIAFSFPALSTLHFMGVGPHNQLASGANENGEWAAKLSATSGTTTTPYGLSTTTLTIVIPFLLITAGTAGNLQFMWCQQVSNGNASTVKAGSFMYMDPVA